MSPYFGAIEYMRARNWEQFSAAMNRWGAPGENQVYADTSRQHRMDPGRAHRGAAQLGRPHAGARRRTLRVGRLPRHGRTAACLQPAVGYVVTANENTIPPSHPAATKGVGYEWSDDFRARRLTSLVSGPAPHRLEDSRAYQLDTVSLPAQRVVALLGGVTDSRPQVSRALDLLRTWDGNMRADSAAAAVFEVWFAEHLRRAVVQAVLPQAAAASGWPRRRDTSAAGAGRTRLVADTRAPRPRAGRLAGGRRCVAREASRSRLDPMARGGRCTGPCSSTRSRRAWTPTTRRRLDVGAWPLGGSSVTPMATAYRASDYQLIVRRVLPDGGRRRQLGRVGRDQHAGAVGRPGKSALSRPRAAVGRRTLLPARLFAWRGGEGDAHTHRARSGTAGVAAATVAR